jgi:hypothetical protein
MPHGHVQTHLAWQSLSNGRRLRLRGGTLIVQAITSGRMTAAQKATLGRLSAAIDAANTVDASCQQPQPHIRRLLMGWAGWCDVDRRRRGHGTPLFWARSMRTGVSNARRATGNGGPGLVRQLLGHGKARNRRHADRRARRRGHDSQRPPAARSSFVARRSAPAERNAVAASAYQRVKPPDLLAK